MNIPAYLLTDRNAIQDLRLDLLIRSKKLLYYLHTVAKQKEQHRTESIRERCFLNYVDPRVYSSSLLVDAGLSELLTLR